MSLLIFDYYYHLEIYFIYSTMNIDIKVLITFKYMCLNNY